MSGILPWFQGVASIGIVGAFFTFLGIAWRLRVPMRKMQVEADQSLRADLLRQLAEQEATHKAEMSSYEARLLRYEERLEEQRKTYEARLDYERVTHTGEMAVFRHKVNNLEAALNMFLVLVEENPEKAQGAAKKIRELRERQETQEVAEKSALTAAKINAASPNV